MTKLIKQEGLKDCGPACLLMIIKHYKGNATIEYLKDLCKTDRLGTTAYHLIEASKKCGFESCAYRCNLNDLNKSNIVLPCIAHVTLNNSYKHFVVIEKIDFKRKKLLIKDPIGKIVNMSFNEFNKIFNNVIINLYPYKNIINEKNDSLLLFFSNILKSTNNQMFQIVLISFFITIFSLITTFYMQFMIDNIISKNRVILIFIIFLIVYILKIVSDFFRNKLIILINEKIDVNLFVDNFKKIIYLPYCYYKNNTTGEIVSRINDLQSVKDIISRQIIIVFIDLPLAFITLIIMYVINVNLFIISFIILLLFILIIILFKNTFNRKIDECSNLKAISTSYMVESINGFETIKGCNIEEKVINNFENKYVETIDKIFEFQNIYNYQNIFKEIINNIGFLVIILIGVLLVIDNIITIGQLLTFNLLLSYFLEPIKNIIELDNEIRQAKISIKKIMNIYQVKNNDGIVDYPMSGDIEFKKLSFTFDEENYVLKDINLKIKEGNKVIVIGQSGSGKSTLFKLLKKYYDVKRNQIKINNIDINDYKDSDVVYVSQNEILFTDTILNNIDSDNIFEVSKICLVDDIIKNNPLGYNTLVEENGFNLSGGQRQRIILARAISLNFNILIIDEGLNQVDTNMERKILKNLFSKYKDKTIVFISHRLDNLDLFDQVVQIEKGSLIKNEIKNDE